MPTIEAARLTQIARRVFAAAGSAEDEAGIIADHLVEANLKGHDSHGVGLIPNYLQHLAGGSVFPNRKGRVVSEDGSLIVYDGERAWGQIAAREAVLTGIAKARETGVAVVALRNPHHIGRVGTYGEICAGEGLVSFHFVNVTDARPAVAPWRGTDARFSTNPICIAIPSPQPERPIILDMATSAIAMGKVRVARNKGEQLKPGILIDAEGRPTTDPGAMYRQPRGALMTIGEHKGYALAFVCEMLAGALCGSGTMRPERQGAGTATNGMLTIVIDPERLVDRQWLVDEIAAMTAYITASPPQKPGEPVLIPGDPERQMRARRLAEGVPIDDETWREVAAAARTINVLVEA
ncbi:MAG TPA: malate/lactate/ureidoglycolate dehydrogenase [Candidatus Dormibacteraeota bacterium]|nr:malate/lactate/ureidoglycolate dehydrogenase [Candidatus Dormibacteraeota bacterium]